MITFLSVWFNGRKKEKEKEKESILHIMSPIKAFGEDCHIIHFK